MAQLASTAFYLTLFGFALLFFWMAEAQYKTDKAVRRKRANFTVGRTRVYAGLSGGAVCSAIAILAVCLAAGLRATSVGSDTSGYPVTFTNVAMMYTNFFKFLQDPVGVGAEPLGALLVWLCSRFNWGIVPLLFCYQLLTIWPIFLAVRVFNERIPLTMAMAVYLLFFFNNSLNMMRQSVSCALLLLAFAIYLSTRKIKLSTVLLCVSSVLFHRAGAYGLVLIILVLLVAKVNRRWLRILLYALITLSPMAMTQISTWLMRSGLADAHMQYYLQIFITGNIDQDWFVNPRGVYSLTYVAIYTVLVFMPILLNTRFFEPKQGLAVRNTEAELYQTLILINVAGYLVYIILLFTLNTMYGMRFSIFLDYFLILSIPLSCRGMLARQKKGIVLVLLTVFWWLWIVRMGWSASAAYQFFF